MGVKTGDDTQASVSDMSDAEAHPPSLISRLLFLFIGGTISRARKDGTLELSGVPQFLRRGLATERLYTNFEKGWELESQKPKPRMVRAITYGQWKRLFGTAILYLISQGSQVAGPLLLREIVSGLSCRDAASQVAADGVDADLGCATQKTLYLYASGLFIAPLIQAFAENNMNYELNKMGVCMRNGLMAAIFRKCLRLNTSSLAAESTGKIVTLMSNDAQKIQDASLAIHTLWGSPLFIIVVMVLLYLQIKWAAFVGLAVMLLLGPITGFVGRKLGLLRRSIVKWTDARTSTMNEVINGMRVIKFYAWEQPFKEEAQGHRAQEAKILRTIAKLQGFFGLVLFSGPVLVSVASFTAYSLAGNELTSADAYTSLALFTLLRFPMSFLPLFIQSAVNASVALSRIRLFLARGEVQGVSDKFHTDIEPGHVLIRDGCFKWDEDAETDTLADINIECKPGSLTMIVGSVGSGKSSVLSTLIQHITCTRGSVSVGGRIAYVPQTAWIMNETVRENVLLGSPMDDERYKAAVSSAQLVPDLKILSDGDMTEIGERGITLSGGQKQRVSIARAVYADADVVIMDDPLSAVDAHVGKSLFENCLRGTLRGKTVLLVTNALHFLHYADQVVWMVDGRVRKSGPYAEVNADPEFAELVGNHVIMEDVADEKTEGEEDEKTKKVEETMELSKSNTKGLTGNEDRASGSVGRKVVGGYVVAGGGALWILTVIIAYVAEQGSKIFTDRWLGFWTADQFDQPLGFYLGLYAGLAVVFGFVTYFRSVTVVFGTVRSTLNLHAQLLDRIMRLPMSFFDTNPSGRIVNRFSRDTDIMDSVLPQSLVQLGSCVSSYLGILVVISLATPWFIIMLPPVTVIYFFLQRYYIPSARELQRLEAVKRSPIYTGFSEAINGISTIRAYNKAAHFNSMSDGRMEDNAVVFISQRAASAWLSIRLDFIGLCVLTAAGLLAVQGGIDPSLAGLSLVYALDLTKFLKFGTQMASKTESDLNSAERIIQYLHENEEAPAHQPGDPGPDEWPTKGVVSVEKIAMRYRADTPLVLQDVSFTVDASAKIGVVGRTGSGKSSLFLAFFRMVELERGRIVIDGVDIASLGLVALRSRLAMIPQDPFMFSGTVRRNLDPFSQYSDQQIWDAVTGVGLGNVIKAFELKLEAPVSDNGSNFSLGQRQLFCLARALLRNAQILMMDEATASVDMDTDLLIQKAVRTSFSHCTVLTIAHRLNTIMDADKVLVMDAGIAAEYDEPSKLLQDPASLFSALVENTGKKSALHLKRVASRATVNRGGAASSSRPSTSPQSSPAATPAASPTAALVALPCAPLGVAPAAAPDATGVPDVSPAGAPAAVPTVAASEVEDGFDINSSLTSPSISPRRGSRAVSPRPGPNVDEEAWKFTYSEVYDTTTSDK